jgi:hypothetical protein
MNAKVSSGINELLRSGVLQSSSIDTSSHSASGMASIQQIQNLPPATATAVREVFRNGVRWAFISLIPWVALAALSSFFLSKIVDPDAEKRKEAEVARREEIEEIEEIEERKNELVEEGEKGEKDQLDYV